MKLAVEPMQLEDIMQVVEVDRESYTLPWPASAYRREILHNRNARYLVLRDISERSGDALPAPQGTSRPKLPIPFLRWTGKVEERSVQQETAVVGYAGMWIMVNEAHITTIALRTEWRGRGLGELLLASLVEMSAEMGIERVTLEVRVSNEPAQNLYRKYGFYQAGLRVRYYSDNNEDAYIMSTGQIQEPEYRRQFDVLVQALSDRLRGDDNGIEAPAFVDLKSPLTQERS